MLDRKGVGRRGGLPSLLYSPKEEKRKKRRAILSSVPRGKRKKLRVLAAEEREKGVG